MHIRTCIERVGHLAFWFFSEEPPSLLAASQTPSACLCSFFFFFVRGYVVSWLRAWMRGTGLPTGAAAVTTALRGSSARSEPFRWRRRWTSALGQKTTPWMTWYFELFTTPHRMPTRKVLVGCVRVHGAHGYGGLGSMLARSALVTSQWSRVWFWGARSNMSPSLIYVCKKKILACYLTHYLSLSFSLPFFLSVFPCLQVGQGTGLGVGLRHGQQRPAHSSGRLAQGAAVEKGLRQRRALEGHRT